MSKFFRQLLDPNSTASSKRLITLVLAAHFVVTSFLVSFFVFYLILYTPKGMVNIDLLNVLTKIFEYDFYIILAGLGFITADALGAMLVEKAKAQAEASIATGLPSAGTVNVDTIAKTVNTDSVNTVNTQSTNITDKPA